MKKLLTFFLTALLAFSVGWAATVEITMSQQGWSNQQDVTSVTKDDVSITFDAGSNTSNSPKYYNTGLGVRLYVNNTMTITAGNNTITSIELRFSSSGYTGNLSANVGNYNVTNSIGRWTGEATSVTFTAGVSHARLQTVIVTYGSSVTPPTQVATIAAAEGLAASTNFEFTGNAVVTYQNGDYLWIRDTSGSGLIYGSGVSTFANGDVLTAGWTATNTTSTQGVPQFESPSGVASSATSGTEAPEALTTLSTADVNKYASISNITITRSNGSNYYYEVNGIEYCVRNHFGLVTLTVGKAYDVVGVVSIYNSAPQLYLISATEIATPYLQVSPNPMSINDTDNTLTVTGENITGNINASLATNDGWYLNPNTFGNTGGTATVTYNGRALSASNTVTATATGATDASATVNYIADLYIVTDNGVTGNWDFTTGTPMTYNNGVYTASFTANVANTFILFARKLGNGVDWNTRYVFGPDSSGDWWLPTSGNGNGNIDLNDDDPIKIQTAGTYIITIDATGNTVTFTITKEVVNEGDFVLVTAATQLAAGNEVIIVNSGEAGAAKAMSTTQNNNNRGDTDVTVTATKKVTATETTQIFTLEGDNTGWYFKTVNGATSGYIYAASNSSNHLKTEAEPDVNGNAKAAISISGNVASIVFQGNNSHNVLQHNSSSSIFSCYGSASQGDVYLYQRTASTEPSITVNPSSLDLVIPVGESSVSGNVTVTETNTTGTTSVSINGDTNIFSATLENGTLTVTYNGNATMTSPDVATITLTNGDATATVNVTGYKLPMTVTITPADGHTFSTSTVTGLIESNVADALIEYSFDGTTWYTYDFNDGFTTPEVSTIGGTVTVYARATKNGETATAQATYTHVAPSTNCTADIVFAPTSNNGGVTTWSTLMDHMSAGTDYISDASMATVYTYMDYDAFRFGSGNNVGHMTFTLDPSKFTGGAVKLTKVTVNAARYRDDTNCELKVSTDVNTTGQTQSITASQTNFADYVFNFDGSEITTLTLANLTAGSRVIVHSISLEYECTSGPATPHISPESGTFSEDQEVEITCTTQGATIYYTINGGEPQVYTDKFNVDLDEDHTSVTIVAWAEKDGETSNQATVTYTYKSDKVYSIAEFLELDEGEEVTFQNPVVVLFDYSQNSSNGQEYIWIKDRTSYTQLFITPVLNNDTTTVDDGDGFWPKYENGDIIPAGFKVKKNYFSGGEYYQGQCFEWQSTFRDTTGKALADPEQVLLSELIAHPDDYNNRYLFINKLKVTGFMADYGTASGKWEFYIAADENDDNVAEVSNANIVGYNKYNSPAWKDKEGNVIGVTVPTDGKYYNVKFIFQKWTGGYELMPIEFTPWEDNSLRLEDLVKEGELNHDYTISNQLHAVAVTWDSEKDMFAIFAKDDGMYANKRYPATGQDTYLIRYENQNGTFINEVEQEDYDQSNWIEILIPSTITQVTSKTTDVNAYIQELGNLQSTFENKILNAGSVRGTYVNALNPTIEVTALPTVASLSTYEPNIYCTANFLMENLDTDGAQGNDGNYFMMDAKPHEFCKVVWAYYDNSNGNYFVIPAREGNVVNGHGFTGSFMANMSLCEDYQVYYDFNQIRTWFLDSNDESYNGQQTLYGFDAIIRKNPNANNSNGAPRRIQPGTGDFEQTPAYIVYPLNAGGNSNDNVVGVKEVLGNKAIESVHYYNMMGMEGKTPFEGINIVVTRYTDGSTSTIKVMK